MDASPARAPLTLNPGAARTTLALGFAASVFDGYDLISFGSAVPALLAHPGWNLTPGAVGVLAGYAPIGMLFGAVVAGPLTDRFGRRPAFLTAVTWFSVMSVLAALAPSPGLLGAARFLAGLGFGAIAPICVALVMEVAPAARRNLWNAILISGLPAGGVLAALLAIPLLPAAGFRVLFALGGIAALVTVVPLAWRLLPESPMHAAAAAAEPFADRMRALLRPGTLAVVAALSVASVAGYLLAYGMNTWLPQFMRQAGYDLGPALLFLLLFNLGSVAGAIAGAMLADRWEGRHVIAFGFLLGAAVTALLAVPFPLTVSLLLVTLAGAASIGTITVLLGYIANSFPAAQRATTVGICSGVGRLGSIGGPLLGGSLAAAGVGLGWSFGAVAIAALAGAVACAVTGAVRPTPVAAIA